MLWVSATFLVAANAFVLPSSQVRWTTRLSSNFQEYEEGGLSRRQFGELGFAAVGLGISFVGTREIGPTDYGLWGILPVGKFQIRQNKLLESSPLICLMVVALCGI